MSQTPKQLSIFVVDDEAVISSTLTTILQMQGYQARSFTLPVAALLAAEIDSPDVLITDVLMPGMSGIDLADKIKKLCPTCKVLLFSGQATIGELIDKARSNGHAFDVLSKPVHPTVLLSKLREVINGTPSQPAHLA